MKKHNIFRVHLLCFLLVLFVVTIPTMAQAPIKKPTRPTKVTPAKQEPVKVKPKPTKQKPSSSSTSANRKPSNGYISGHEYVDLGLSVKWATCNVGASSPEDYGDYFAWGETKPKSSYTEENSVTYKKDMGSIAGNSTYDAARANWGGTWRLPTKDEMEELKSNCATEWATRKGVKGRLVMSKKNGNRIFLPATGWRDGTSSYGVGGHGYYWSATPYESDAGCAYGLYFSSGFGSYWGSRYNGHSVRPVSE